MNMEFKDLYIIDGIIYAYESNNGVYAKLVDILTGYEILINLENLWRFESVSYTHLTLPTICSV